jgi:hypothetical protein
LKLLFDVFCLFARPVQRQPCVELQLFHRHSFTRCACAVEMKTSRPSLLLFLLGVPLLVAGQREILPAVTPTPQVPAGSLDSLEGKDTDIQGLLALQSSAADSPSNEILQPSPLQTHIPLSATTASPLAPGPSTTPTSSALTSITNAGAPTSGIPSSGAPTNLEISSSSPTLTPTSISTHIITARHMSKHHRDVVIILSVVLGVFGLLLIGAAIFLACRYCQGKAPFNNRGATPINDEEIQSWRGTSMEPKQHQNADPQPQVYPPLEMSMGSIALGQSPGHPTRPTAPSSAHHHSSSSVAKAPNARAGLTDETIPGAAPFIPPAVKRQNSLLSKTPLGHVRTKSRSSTSAKNLSRQSDEPERIHPWYDPDLDSVGKEVRDTDHTSSSPGTSIFDGLTAGGLSPRPRSQARRLEKEDEVGRAIA